MQSFADALIDIIEDARDEGADHDNVPKILETANKVRPGNRAGSRARVQPPGAAAAAAAATSLLGCIGWGRHSSFVCS